MGIKPLVVAARYKLLLLLPFAVILPLAAAVSFMQYQKTEYTAVARLLAQESAIIDNIIDSNPYTSPAENRASDLREQLATDAFNSRVAERIGMPTTPASALQASMWEIEAGTSAYANGRHLVVIMHTSPSPERASKIVAGIVEEFRAQYRENVTLNSDNATKVYESQLNEQRKTLEAAEAELAAYLSRVPQTSNLNTDVRYVALQKTADRAQRDYESTQQAIRDIKLQAQATIDGQDFTLTLKDPASTPTSPDLVGKRQLVALPIAGFLVALSIAAAMYAFLLRTDNRIRTAEDLQALPGLVLLGTVPDVDGMRRPRWPKNFFRIAIAGLGVNPVRPASERGQGS
jgi:capsular polysaccharide biosynthesis protein